MLTMPTKIVSLFVQTLFFFMAITVISFFAEVLSVASSGHPFQQAFERWALTEFSLPKTMLRLAAAVVYVLIRNRRLFLNR